MLKSNIKMEIFYKTRFTKYSLTKDIVGLSQREMYKIYNLNRV